VANYLELDGGAAEEIEALLTVDGGEKMRAMTRNLRQALLEEGLEQGIEQGIEKGIEQGIEQGKERGMREMLSRLLTRRFGPLPPVVIERLEQIRSTDELARLAERVLQASSLADLDLT